MPSDSGIAFVIIMHFDPSAKSVMADILKNFTQMEVLQVNDGVMVIPNSVYIIPPNKDMAILHGTLQLYDSVVQKGIRHPIDFFFRSLADDLKEKAICIILSGTGTEGTLGLKSIKGEGGLVMVEDLESAAYDGMPRSAIATGLADYILTPDKMPQQLINYTKHYLTKEPGVTDSDINNQIGHYLQKIISLVRNQTGHDFSQYKQGTLIRRIERRMNLHQIDNGSDFLRYIQENPSEIQNLFKEFLIGVTSFFRDPESYLALKDKVQDIFKNKTTDQPIRIWVPACSTGEEAYSIAIIFKEYIDLAKSDLKVQIFATDLDKDAIEKGRSGTYPKNIAIDVSPERIERFFLKKYDSYILKKEIRDMVIFAPQNIIGDPPFLRTDLISCKNLLIYLNPEIQKKILSLFHYSLNPGGFLFLGSSETIGESADLFTIVDKKWKLFNRTGGKAPLPLMPYSTHVQPKEKPYKTEELKPTTFGKETEQMLLDTFAPPCVIVNERGDIFYIHGRTGKFLEPAPGKANLNILEMAREGLKTELNIALHTVIRDKKEIAFKELNVKTNSHFQTVNLTIRPISEPNTMQGQMIVIFEEAKPSKSSKPKKVIHKTKQMEGYVSNLENDLKATRENLQASIEELQASNEELRSSNEELQSANEEMQSTNEELHSSKEELQSLNEELITLNAEHSNTIEKMSNTLSDMHNIMASTNIATIFLDIDLRIKGFTPATTKLINLIESDIGCPINDISLNIEPVNLIKDANEVLKNLIPIEKEVRSITSRNWYLMRIIPYRTIDNVIEGVVITFIDITERKKAELSEHDARVFNQNIVETVRESLLVLDKDLRVIFANSSFYRIFKVLPAETENICIYNIANCQWDIPRLKALLEEIIPKDNQFNNYEIEHQFPDLGRKTIRLNARKIVQSGEGTEKILLAIEVVS